MLKKSLFHLYGLVWDQEAMPEAWQKTNIIQIYKGKGPEEDLDNQRNIHVKSDIPKLFGHIVVTA